MDKQEGLKFLGKEKIIGILRTDSPEQAIAAAREMARAGMKIIEVTFTVPGAAAAIAELVKTLPDCVIGAGSITTVERCKSAMASGARFIVSPNFDADVVRMTCEAGLISCPGVLTPTEMVAAHAAGADVLKIFPINCLGGPTYLKAVRGPLPEYRFCPTGGVDKTTIKAFLDAGAFCTGAGGNLVPMKEIRAGNYEAVYQNTREFVEARDAAIT